MHRWCCCGFLVLSLISYVKCKLTGLRVEDLGLLTPYKEDRIVRIHPSSKIPIRLFGTRMDEIDEVLFSPTRLCNMAPDGPPPLDMELFEHLNSEMAIFSILFPKTERVYYLCIKWRINSDNEQTALTPHEPSTRSAKHNWTLTEAETHYNSTPLEGFIFQGAEYYKMIGIAEPHVEHYLPVGLQIAIIICLLLLSGLFSGLNLGLMSLDPTGNVIVNSGISILFDDLTSGFVALIVASLGIVIFGEIVPQSVCSRYGLAVGAKTIWVTKFFMILTAPLSWPISKILDKILGAEVGAIYNKDRLLELIRLSKESNDNELENCMEVAIVSGALELSQKTVSDIMTHIRDVFMLSREAILDMKTVSLIVKSGYTRIPIYEGTRDNIVTLLNVKDLALLDPAEKVPVKTVCEFYQHPVAFVAEDTPLNVMLEEFKKGHYHMSFVRKLHNDVNMEGDPAYELVGIVTLEDIIEEIIQSEIVDETDVITDNRRRLRRKEAQVRDFTFFTESDVEHFLIAPQLAFVVYQFLSTGTDLQAFQRNYLSETVLQKLIKQNALEMKAETPSTTTPTDSKFLYTKGKVADYFILLLEGRVEVTAGLDNFVFEAGPFFHFGKQTLERTLELLVQQRKSVGSSIAGTPGSCGSKDYACIAFVPDFTVRVVQNVVYLYLKASTYVKAFKDTLTERGNDTSAIDTLLCSQAFGSGLKLSSPTSNEAAIIITPSAILEATRERKKSVMHKLADFALIRKHSRHDSALSASATHRAKALHSAKPLSEEAVTTSENSLIQVGIGNVSSFTQPRFPNANSRKASVETVTYFDRLAQVENGAAGRRFSSHASKPLLSNSSDYATGPPSSVPLAQKEWEVADDEGITAAAVQSKTSLDNAHVADNIDSNAVAEEDGEENAESPLLTERQMSAQF